MKRLMRLALILALLALALPGAAAQTLPGIDCFSPGLLRLSALEAQGAPVRAEAEFSVEHAMYARDLSVLAAMLSDTTFCYEGDGGAERLSIVRGGDTLASCALAREGGSVRLELDGTVYDVSSLADARLEALSEALAGKAPLERVPLTDVAGWLEGLTPGDALPGGFAVTEAFTLERTLSDDGTRLTRIDVHGAVAREGEAPYMIAGFLRQPAGRSPKDTFELTFTQDEQNYIELSYSALRENTVASKDKKGETSVRTSLKAAGKLAGSRISSRLTVTTKNSWTADGESLNEKIIISATLTHQDNRSGMRMSRLNSVEGEARHTIALTTREGEDDAVALTDQTTMKVVLDGNTLLNGGADIRMTVGGETPVIAVGPAEREAAQPELTEAVGRAARELAAAIYPYLGESAKAKIQNGL